MPRIKREALAPAFTSLHEASGAANETNDCTVKALAVATGMSYAEAHAAMAAEGRKPGKGAHGIERAIMKAGFGLIRLDLDRVIRSFPKPHCNVLKNFTTHHPRRFPGCIDPDKVYIAHVRGHVLAIRDGVVQDWSINRSLRVYKLVEVIKPKG